MPEDDPLAALSAAAKNRTTSRTVQRRPAAVPSYQSSARRFPGQPQTTNGMAIASLVCSLIPIGIIGGILAICFGFSAKGQIRRSKGRQSGSGLATAGIIIGFIDIAASFAVAIIVVVLVFSAPVAVRVVPSTPAPVVHPPGELFKNVPAEGTTPPKPDPAPAPEN